MTYASRYASARNPVARATGIDRRGGAYDFAELRSATPRPGADDGQQHPSRMGNRLHFRDGRITDLAGRAIAATA